MRHLWFVFIGLIAFVTTVAQAADSSNIETGTYNQDDQLIKIVKPDGTTIEYTYDDNGNLSQKKTSEGTWNFTYNEKDQLVRVDHHHSGWQGKPPFEVVIVYAYDPAGRRVFKDVDGVRTYYFHTDEGLAEEYDQTGKVIRQYGHAPDSSLPRWVKTATGTYFYYYDQLGTPQKLVDQNGTILWEAIYDDFGKAQVITEVVENNLRFPGQYYDAETGLHYNWHRYYDPETGRYLTRDPMGDGANDYVYAGNNPVNAIDPTGLVIESIDASIERYLSDFLAAKRGPYAWTGPAKSLGKLNEMEMPVRIVNREQYPNGPPGHSWEAVKTGKGAGKGGGVIGYILKVDQTHRTYESFKNLRQEISDLYTSYVRVMYTRKWTKGETVKEKNRERVKKLYAENEEYKESEKKRSAENYKKRAQDPEFKRKKAEQLKLWRAKKKLGEGGGGGTLGGLAWGLGTGIVIDWLTAPKAAYSYTPDDFVNDLKADWPPWTAPKGSWFVGPAFLPPICPAEYEGYCR